MSIHKLQVIVLLAVVLSSHALNNRPIIGILTQPTDGGLTKYGSSYIAASYVKYIEGAGGRVVPVFHNSTTDQLDRIFSQINGLFFPGGGSDLNNTPLFKAGQYLYNKALKAYDTADYFPIVGHCQGFELLALITSKDFNILSPAYAENVSMPLELTATARSSRWLKNAPSTIIDTLINKPVTLNNHQWGVYPSVFAANAYLPKFYDILSTNVDLKGVRFISLWEGIKYPVYGAQWHAEKPQYEWNPAEAINHSPESVRVMQYFAEFFVNEARKSNHKFSSYDDEYNTLIYNYDPIYSQKMTGDFEQCYVF